MPTDMKHSLQTAWREVFRPALAILPALTAGEQTKLSWAKVIESYAAVPPAYKEFFEPFLAEKRPFPYTVLTPSCEGFLHRTAESLICDLGDEIYILKKHRNTATVECYPYGGISYAEVGTILLDSWIKISGVTSQGVPASSTFKFNSATDELFMPLLDRIRCAPDDSGGLAPSAEVEKFNTFGRLNFKLMNYARRSLLAGEKVICTVLQPEIRGELLVFMGKTYYRTIATAHISILTNSELILIREPERWGRGVRYGGIWDYIALDKIASLSLSEKRDNLFSLSIHLSEGAHLEIPFEASMQEEVNLLVEQFRRYGFTGGQRTGFEG